MSDFKIDWDFIGGLEGKGANQGYVPSLNSGVTIATGFDLKEKDRNFLTSIGLNTNLIDKLTPYLGISGAEAEEVAKNLRLSDPEVMEVDLASKEFYAQNIADQFNTKSKVNFSDLSVAQQTVVASVGFQYGNLSNTPTFFKHAANGNWDLVEAELRDFKDDFSTRRNTEADYLKKKSKYWEQQESIITEKLARQKPTEVNKFEEFLSNTGKRLKEKKDQLVDFITPDPVEQKEIAEQLQKKVEPKGLDITVPLETSEIKNTFIDASKPEPTKSFFTDRTDKRYRGNGMGMITTPKTFSQVMDAAHGDLYNYGRSVSSWQGLIEDWELVQQEMFDKFGIQMPHFNDYIPEVDPSLLTPAPYKEKIAYLEKFIKKTKKDAPNHIVADFKGYDHFFYLRQKRAAESEKDLGLAMMYADGTWDKWGGMLVGTGKAGFQDPVILASLPISFLYGWQGGIVYAALRTAAIEAIIGAGAETIIQTQVVPYRQKLGQDYTWGDAAKIIGTVSLASGIFAGGLTAGVKSTAALVRSTELALAKTNPDIRNKIIGREFDKLTKKNPDPELLFEYIKDRINALPPTEMIVLFNSLPDAIKLHPPYKNAAQDLENKILEDIDNPLKKNTAGQGEHNERVNGATESIIKNEEIKISESPTAALDIDESRPIMMDVRLKPDEIEFDAKTFQFKTGGDSLGVQEKLIGVKKWDQEAAGSIMVWQRADGKYFVADGHQRLGLAKRIKKKDPKQDVYLTATIRREKDGWTASDTMVEAMTLNIVTGTARSADVARILFKLGETLTAARLEGRIKPTQAIWDNAMGLYKLGDEGFQYWLKGNIKDTIAAEAGHIIKDPSESIAALKLLVQGNPASKLEARAMIRDAQSIGTVQNKTMDMFGESMMTEYLIVERSKVLSAVIKNLKKETGIFKALVENDETITKSARNKLDTDYNIKKAEQNAIAIQKIEVLANRRGKISDELTAAARLWKDGRKSEAIKSFTQAVIEGVKRGDHKGIDASGAERSVLATQSESPTRQKPKESVITEKLEAHDDPHGSKPIKIADDTLEEIKTELKVEVEEGGALSDIRAEISLLESKIQGYQLILDQKKGIKTVIKKIKSYQGSFMEEAKKLSKPKLEKEINQAKKELKKFKKQQTQIEGEIAYIGEELLDIPTVLKRQEKIKELEAQAEITKGKEQTKIIEELNRLYKERGFPGKYQTDIEEIKPGAAVGERITSDTVKEPSGTRTQEEFFQATTAEPPSSVLAKAKGIPSASRILEDNLIGDVKTVSGINHKILQISDSVDNLYKLANKNISNIEASITNIAIKFKKSRVIVDIKRKSELLKKLKARQKIYGKDYDIRFIGDLARGRIVLEDLDEVVDGLVIEGWLRNNFRIVQKKDYFADIVREDGYRATHYQLVTEDGLAFELQVHHKDLLTIYDRLRELPGSSYNKIKHNHLTPKQEIELKKLVAQEKKLFDAAWSDIQLKQKGLPEQKAVDEGLFDVEGRKQMDLTDEIATVRVATTGEEIVETKTLKQVIDDVEEDGKIIKFLKDCPGIK